MDSKLNRNSIATIKYLMLSAYTNKQQYKQDKNLIPRVIRSLFVNSYY